MNPLICVSQGQAFFNFHSKQKKTVIGELYRLKIHILKPQKWRWMEDDLPFQLADFLWFLVVNWNPECTKKNQLTFHSLPVGHFFPWIHWSTTLHSAVTKKPIRFVIGHVTRRQPWAWEEWHEWHVCTYVRILCIIWKKTEKAGSCLKNKEILLSRKLKSRKPLKHVLRILQAIHQGTRWVFLQKKCLIWSFPHFQICPEFTKKILTKTHRVFASQPGEPGLTKFSCPLVPSSTLSLGHAVWPN